MSLIRCWSKPFPLRQAVCSQSCVGARLSSNSADNDERYIQYSKLPTYHFQPGLMRLPIPKLSDTCSRYLAALEPVATSDFQQTKKLVEQFGEPGGIGQELHKKLVANDSRNKHTSYISGPWFDMYLSDRQSLVLNYNPFIAFKEDPLIKDQALRAANFVWSAVRFRASLVDKKLEPEIFHLNPEKSDNQRYRNIMKLVPRYLSCYVSFLWKAFPLDMSQYSRLFNSTRLPVYQAPDHLESYGTVHRHLVVMRNGHFYRVDVVQENGLPVPCETLCKQFRGILADETAPPSHPIGYLTGLNRDEWAGFREELVKGNQENLEMIDTALFVLCLDNQEPTTAEQLSHLMLHNAGANRWFDKSFQLLVTKGAHSAVLFEHAWGDGVAVLRFFNELYKDRKTHVLSREATLEGVVRLDFDLSPRIKSGVEAAKRELEERTESLSIDTLKYHKYGKNEIKKHGFSPDAVMQLAFQLLCDIFFLVDPSPQMAYYRLSGGCVPTYESCSTAAFRHGRTETIRSATMATKQCAEAFDRSHQAGAEEMKHLISAAATYHSKLVKEAAMGQGFDRHLFALKNLAANEGISVPIFEDPQYAHLTHIILSTSTLSADAVLLGGFAPVTPDGYGVGYGIMDDWLGTQVSTYSTRDGAQFVQQVEGVLDDIHTVITGNSFK